MPEQTEQPKPQDRSEKSGFFEKVRKSTVTKIATIAGGVSLAVGVGSAGLGVDSAKAQESPTQTPTLATEVFSFSDVSENTPYHEAIYSLFENGVIEGFQTGDIFEFRPESPVTRAQFAKMIVKTLNIPVSESDISEFKDIEDSGKDSLYPDNYVAAAEKAGIIKGKTAEVFDPSGNITGEQVITMIVRALQNKYSQLNVPEGYTSNFDGDTSVHAKSLREAQYYKIFANIDLSKWENLKPATRGEIAQELWNLKNFSGEHEEITGSTETEIQKSYHVPILMYHAVDTIPLPGEWGEALIIPTKQFKSEMEYLKNNGYHTITLAQLYENMSKNTSVPAKTVVITFDDGYLDQYTQAFPILRDLGLTATFFICTNAVNNADPSYINWEGLKEMSKAGMDIESHTVHHWNLATLDRDKLCSELADSKKALEGNLGITVNLISYPEGQYNAEVLKATQEAGYLGAVTCVDGKNFKLSNSFELPRQTPTRGESLSTFIGHVK
jgi:peptidoglycan/xylan/chitin deacetylase (PgdA/CDA1 family)